MCVIQRGRSHASVVVCRRTDQPDSQPVRSTHALSSRQKARPDRNSASRRRADTICYNRVDNDTFVKGDDRNFVPLEKVDDDALRRAGPRFARRDNQEHLASRPYVPDVRKVS